VVVQEQNMNVKMILAALAATAALGLMACEKQGPLEKAGEEVDEAVDTVKNGEESTASKVDDAIDEARETVEDKQN
jgi:hypothetical protein